MTWEKGRELCLWMYVWHTGNPEFWVWLWLLTNPWPRTSCLNSWISQMCALLLFIGLAMDFNKQTLSLITYADTLCYPVVKKKYTPKTNMRTPKILSHEHILLNNTEKKKQGHSTEFSLSLPVTLSHLSWTWLLWWTEPILIFKKIK